MHQTYSRIKGFGLIGIHIGALAAFWPGFFSWSALAAAGVVSYATVALGISLCFHRILTHRSLRLLKPIEYLFAIFGTLALQADPIRWVSVHRKHHAHADHEGDPHSIAEGFKWAHMDWIYRHNIALPSDEEMRHFAPDLYAEPFYRALQYLNIPLQVMLALGLFAFGGWSWVVWGIFVRLAVATIRPGWSIAPRICWVIAPLRPRTNPRTAGGWRSSVGAKAGITITTPFRFRHGTGYVGLKSI